MALPGSDEPESISQEEARQELFGRGPSRVGMEVYEVVAIVLGIVGAAIAFEEIDNWSQWLVLAAIVGTVLGLIIALNPSRRE
jgi:hypothetical protein